MANPAQVSTSRRTSSRTSAPARLPTRPAGPPPASLYEEEEAARAAGSPQTLNDLDDGDDWSDGLEGRDHDVSVREWGAILSAVLPGEYDGPLCLPTPTVIEPGPDRVEILCQRREAGLALWHPCDPGNGHYAVGRKIGAHPGNHRPRAEEYRVPGIKQTVEEIWDSVYEVTAARWFASQVRRSKTP